MKKFGCLCACVLSLLAQGARAQCTGVDYLELERLSPPVGSAGSELGFGIALAASDEFLFVGQPLLGPYQGHVRVFRQDPGGSARWSLLRTLDGPGVVPTPGHFGGGEAPSLDGAFGTVLAAEGDLLVVGHPAASEGFSGAGAVSIHERDLGGPGAWGLRVRLTSPAPAAGAGFGSSLALAGGQLFVASSPTAGAGAGTWVYRRGLGGPDAWGLVKQVRAQGGALAADDVSLLVGVPGDSTAAPGAGAVYVHRRGAGGAENWGLVRQMLASDAAAGDGFGSAVALSLNTAVVGAPGADVPEVDAGAFYVLERHLGGLNAWGEVIKRTCPAPVAGDELGRHLDVREDRLVAGIPRGAGATHVFERNQGGPAAWGEVLALDPPGPVEERFGRAVLLLQQDLFVGTRGSAHVLGRGYPASVSVRPDAGGVNPLSYQASPMLVGETFTATVDLSTTGHSLARLIGFRGVIEQPLSGGQVLLVGGGSQLFPPMIAIGPLAVFQIQVPNDPTLCGQFLSTQAVHLMGVEPYALSNAIDFVVGTGQ